MKINNFFVVIILISLFLFGCNIEQGPVELDTFQSSSLEHLKSDDKILVAENSKIVTKDEGGIEATIFSAEINKITYTEDQLSRGVEGNSRFIDITEYIISLNLELTNNSGKTISYDMIPVEIITTDGKTLTSLIFDDKLNIKLDNEESTYASIIGTISDEDVEGIEI